MTVNQIPPGNGSWHLKGFMILTPSQVKVAAGEEFTSCVAVWPAGPRHVVSASAPAGSDLQVKVKGHRVTVTGRLERAGEQYTVHVTVRDGTDIAHDTLTIEASDMH
ncbi:hypothetical protein [Streptomyces shenzhenensis]|uniref:hypothetical protein n=1 Tax=Streptomyces shenzhenensis TaxID=943815 RepID=UPI001F1F8995|nr:hypothetical protein [Streptomyces shenzhenensis]